MWLIDLIHDPGWIKTLGGRLPDPKLTINTKSLSDPTLDAELLIYGDEALRHFRVLVKRASSKEDCDSFVQKQLNKVICTIETAVTMAIGHAFEIWRPFNSPHLIQLLAESKEDGRDPVPIIELNTVQAAIDYGRIAQAMGIQFPGSEDYLFLFKRGIDHRLDVDYRWLSLYKICERRFSSGRNVKLPKEQAWKDFLVRMQNTIQPYLPAGKNSVGYLEELRAAAAHSLDSDTFGHDPRIEETLSLIKQLACIVINELPGNPGINLQAEGLKTGPENLQKSNEVIQ